MPAAIVTGVAALVIATNQVLTFEKVRQPLLDNARSVGELRIIDAHAAARAAKNVQRAVIIGK
jgi:hypothetical protein